MLNIYLIRHGQNTDNLQGILNGRRDEPLTELGEAQAFETANHIKALGLHFDTVYSSPLVRALRTAEIITKELGMPPPQILEDLMERDFGVMTGEPLSRIEELCAPNILKTGKVTYFLSAKGAEAFPQMLTRSRKLLKRIAVRYPSGNVLLVTHADIGKMIYAAYYHLDWKEALQSLFFGNGDILLLSPDSPADEAHVFTQVQQNG